MYYTQEQIDHANQADLVSFLQSQGEQLTRAGNEYRWKRHDSLTVRGNKWYRHSQSKGGGPVDFLMEFFGKSFTEAVELLTGEKGAAPPPDSPAPLSDFRLPPRSPTAEQVKRYLTEARRIDEAATRTRKLKVQNADPLHFRTFTIICVNNSKKHLTKRFMGNCQRH